MGKDGDMDIEFSSRIAVLEELARQGKDDREELKTSVADLADKVSELITSVERYKGFWGGAMIVSGAVWTFFTFAWDYVVRQIKGE